MWRAYRPALPPSRLTKGELASRIESAVGNALHGRPVTWRRLAAPAVELARAGPLASRGALDLEARLDNWPDPKIRATFRLDVACRAGKLTVRVRQVRFEVDSPRYADAATLGLVDRKIEEPLEQAVRSASPTRRTSLPLCPPALGVTEDADLVLF